jgi:hypothetical protein
VSDSRVFRLCHEALHVATKPGAGLWTTVSDRHVFPLVLSWVPPGGPNDRRAAGAFVHVNARVVGCYPSCPISQAISS